MRNQLHRPAFQNCHSIVIVGRANTISGQLHDIAERQCLGVAPSHNPAAAEEVRHDVAQHNRSPHKPRASASVSSARGNLAYRRFMAAKFGAPKP